MTTITIGLIQQIVGRMSAKQQANAESVVTALKKYAVPTGLNQPHRSAQYLAQILHESGAFRYDREVWGPTPAQKRYEGRKDLGNTQPGDGKKFAGRTAIQITGRANTRAFRDWCKALTRGTTLIVPDFEKTPDAMNTDPWEGLGPIWYWDTRKLNRYADAGDIEMITKRINGGLNGYDDRIRWYVRTALVMLGFGPTDVKGFQEKAGLTVDGDPGPRTRAALHKALADQTDAVFQSEDVSTAPVVDHKTVEKPVVPDAVEETVKRKTGFWGWLTGIGGSAGVGLATVAGTDWQTVAVLAGAVITTLLLIVVLRTRIASAIREISDAVGGE